MDIQGMIWQLKNAHVSPHDGYIKVSPGARDIIISMLERLKQQPERKHGTYIEDEWGIPHCSECGAINNTVYRNFCPECGADMRKDGDQE